VTSAQPFINSESALVNTFANIFFDWECLGLLILFPIKMNSENVFWDPTVKFYEGITKTGMAYELAFCLH